MVTPQLPRHPVLAFLRHSTLYAHTVSQFICTKGQLISECPFGVIIWTKITTKKFDKFLP